MFPWSDNALKGAVVNDKCPSLGYTPSIFILTMSIIYLYKVYANQLAR